MNNRQILNRVKKLAKKHQPEGVTSTYEGNEDASLEIFQWCQHTLKSKNEDVPGPPSSDKYCVGALLYTDNLYFKETVKIRSKIKDSALKFSRKNSHTNSWTTDFDCVPTERLTISGHCYANYRECDYAQKEKCRSEIYATMEAINFENLSDRKPMCQISFC